MSKHKLSCIKIIDDINLSKPGKNKH